MNLDPVDGTRRLDDDVMEGLFGNGSSNSAKCEILGF